MSIWQGTEVSTNLPATGVQEHMSNGVGVAHRIMGAHEHGIMGADYHGEHRIMGGHEHGETQDHGGTWNESIGSWEHMGMGPSEHMTWEAQDHGST